MGQQQLILLVLATVIVGVAIIVGIRAFTENSARANADAMMQDAVRIGNDYQAWLKKPAQLRGTQNPDDVTFRLLGYQATADAEYTNSNGTFTISPSSVYDDNGTPGDPSDDILQTVGLCIEAVKEENLGAAESKTNEVVLEVTGLTDQDIDGVIMVIDGESTGATAPCSV